MAMVARKPMIGSRDVWTRSRCTLQAQAKPHHTHKNVQASPASDYASAELAFKRLLATPHLDVRVRDLAGRTQQDLQAVEVTATSAMATAFSSQANAMSTGMEAPEQTQPSGGISDNCVYSHQEPCDAAHLFLQRLLYFINRLNHFWFDELDNYMNERSIVIASLRNTIEGAWAEWELQQLPSSAVQELQKLSPAQVKHELDARYERDKDPPPSETGQYIAADMQLEGYRQLLAVGSLDGLTEASRQSRVCAGAANQVSNAVFRVLMEEYGSGQLSRKHSTFYASMMRELGLSDRTEAYLDLVPWQALASANHNFMLTETRRGYLRYLGALTYFEIVGPAVYQNYLKAAQRLGLSEAASWYWDLHIKEDERHGKWMLQDVAKPAVDMYPRHAWEVLLGYDQEVAMSGRAAKAVSRLLKQADYRGFPQ